MSGETGGRLTTAIARVQESRQSHVEWAAHLRSCDHCREHPPEHVHNAEEQDRIVADYDNVLACLNLAARLADRDAALARVEALAEHLGTDTHDCFKPWCPTCSVIKRERQIKADMLAALHPDPSERGGE